MADVPSVEVGVPAAADGTEKRYAGLKKPLETSLGMTDKPAPLEPA